jgi:hypothetical protein
MPNSKKPSKKELRQIISESIFDPRNPGLLSPILESNNPEYLFNRAVELIREAQLAKNKNPQLKLAISLLGMARLLLRTPQEVEKPKRAKPCAAKIIDRESKPLGTCILPKDHVGPHQAGGGECGQTKDT